MAQSRPSRILPRRRVASPGPPSQGPAQRRRLCLFRAGVSPAISMCRSTVKHHPRQPPPGCTKMSRSRRGPDPGLNRPSSPVSLTKPTLAAGMAQKKALLGVSTHWELVYLDGDYIEISNARYSYLFLPPPCLQNNDAPIAEVKNQCSSFNIKVQEGNTETTYVPPSPRVLRLP